MHRATLAALLTRGPWKTVDGPLDALRLEAVYKAIEAGKPLNGGSDRRIDRALQLLRKAGLIRCGAGRKWEVTRG